MYFPSKINVPTKSKEAKCFTYITNKKPYLHTQKMLAATLWVEKRENQTRNAATKKKLKEKLIFFFKLLTHLSRKDIWLDIHRHFDDGNYATNILYYRAHFNRFCVFFFGLVSFECVKRRDDRYSCAVI